LEVATPQHLGYRGVATPWHLGHRGVMICQYLGYWEVATLGVPDTRGVTTPSVLDTGELNTGYLSHESPVSWTPGSHFLTDHCFFL